MNEEPQARKIQKPDRTSKKIATQTYSDKIQWPPCPVQAEVIMKSFAEAWPPPTGNSQEVDQISISDLEEWLP
jgi:hypothetical protein